MQVSIIMPYYNAEKYIKETVDAIIAQTYKNWELCIANASPEDESMREVLKEYCAKDVRILAEELSRRDMDYADITQENYDEIVGRMQRYMEEFRMSGVDHLTLED